MCKLLRIAPELPVSNVQHSVAYCLGFHAVMTMPAGDYAIVERDGVAIHLFRSAEASSQPVSIHIFTEGIDALHAELSTRGALVKQDIIRQPWGNRDFRVHDDAGNEIKFTEPLENL